MKRNRSNSNSGGRTSIALGSQARAAIVNVTIVLIASMVLTAFSLYATIVSPIQYWQDYSTVAASGAIVFAGLIGLRHIRRGRTVFGVQVVLGTLFIVLPIVTGLRSGLGLVLGLSVIAATVAIAGPTLPARQVSWAIVIATVVSAIILLIELYWPFFRSPAPVQLQEFVPIVSLGIVLFLLVTVVRQFSAYPLQTKLLLAFFIVALIPLAIQTLSNDAAARAVLTATANQSLANASSETASEISDFFKNQSSQLAIDASLPDVINYLSLSVDNRSPGSIFERQTSDLLRTLAQGTPLPAGASPTPDNQPVYYLLDANGQITASSDRSNLAQSAADQDFFKGAVQNAQPYFSPVIYSDAASPAVLYVAVPVYERSQPLLGVLAARYSTSLVQAIIVRHNNLAGPQSFAVVYDIVGQNYIHIAHGLTPDAIGKAVGPLNFRTAEQLQTVHRLPKRPLDQLSTNLPALNDQLLRAADQPFFAAQYGGPDAKINQVAIAAVDSVQWLVAFFQPQAVYLLPVDQQSQNSIKLALAFGVIVAGIAVATAQLLTAPIVRLTGVATRVTAGDLSARARVETRDEIGGLAEGFNTMTAQLQDLIGSLEKRVEARTEQLRASAEVGRAAASILDTERLLREVVNLITDRFGFYYAAIFLNDEANKYTVLHEATGEAGRILKERGHQLEIGGQSMVSGAITTRRPRIALDVGAEPVRFANPLLPETRSEIALPLVVGDRTLGALDVQSTGAAAFDETFASVLQSMADQIAIALSNTQQFSRTESALRQTNVLYEAGRQIAASNSADEILSALIAQAAPDADCGALITFGPIDESGQVSYLKSTAVYSNGWAEFDMIAGARFQPEQLPMVDAATSPDPTIVENYETSDARMKQGLDTLKAKALISLPLIAGNKRLGACVLGYRVPQSFSSETIQILAALSNQAAVALQSQQLLAETQAALKQLDAINRRLIGQAWRDYTQDHGAVQAVDAGPGVPAAVSSKWIESIISSDHVQTTGPIGDARSALIAPIELRGKVIGALSLQEISTEREWTENEIALLQTVANDVAIAIENARLIEQTERRAERERIITEISSRMFAANDIQDIVKVAGDELARILQVARAQVQIGGEYLAPTLEDSDAIHEHNGH